LPEAMSRNGGNPVRVATSGVEHHSFRMALRLSDERVLDLEWAQLHQLRESLNVHRELFLSPKFR